MQPPPTTTSTGLVLSAAGCLDTHYLAGQPEYESMLRSAGFRKGWRVLDGGSGFVHVRRTITYVERQMPLRAVEAKMVAELVG